MIRLSTADGKEHLINSKNCIKVAYANEHLFDMKWVCTVYEAVGGGVSVGGARGHVLGTSHGPARDGALSAPDDESALLSSRTMRDTHPAACT